MRQENGEGETGFRGDGAGGGWGGGLCSLVACLNNLTVDHAAFSKGRTVPTPPTGVWKKFVLPILPKTR